MQILKDGTVKFKKSAYKESERLSTPPFPLPLFTQGTKVQVYLGAGWGTGHVVSSRQDHCVVRLSVGSRTITVFDARSIRQAKE